MNRLFLALALFATAGLLTVSVSDNAEAGSRKYRSKSSSGLSNHRNSKYYRGKGPQVRSYRRRVGGYSYSAEDTINTYGDSRTRFGSTNSYRDPFLDRQTSSGPFDHGFFFDSSTAPRGGNSPYLN